MENNIAKTYCTNCEAFVEFEYDENEVKNGIEQVFICPSCGSENKCKVEIYEHVPRKICLICGEPKNRDHICEMHRAGIAPREPSTYIVMWDIVEEKTNSGLFPILIKDKRHKVKK